MGEGDPTIHIQEGRATLATTVAQGDTAAALGSGDVPVLATPRLLALMEWAARIALDPSLGAGETSVGTSVAIEHLAPSAVGASVVVGASIIGRDGRRVTFDVDAVDPRTGARIATGRHERVVVNRDRFIEGASRVVGDR
jgi:fluoroacetyl-CoA thioesterase